MASLTDGLRLPTKKLHTSQTSPPVVYKNLVIVGSRIPDRIQYKFEPPGTVQAFDARTGKRAWVFYTIPQSGSEFGADTWENESWNFTGHANVWGPMTLDESRGLLYVPVSTPGSDYWGGRRLGANLFAESLVCLDASDRQAEVALSGGAPRPVGLRLHRGAEPRDDHRRTASGSTPSPRCRSRGSPTCSIA